MNAVVVEQLWPVYARAVPVDQRRVAIPVHAIGDHSIVRLLPAPWHLDVHENHDAPVRERLHHRVELLRGKGPVIADVDNDRIAQRLRVSSLLQNVQRRLCLPPDRSIDIRAGNGGAKRLRGAHHHRIADHGNGNVRGVPVDLRRTVGRPSRRRSRWNGDRRALIGGRADRYGSRRATERLPARRRDDADRLHRKVLGRGRRL